MDSNNSPVSSDKTDVILQSEATSSSEIGSRYYGESDKAQGNPEEVGEKQTVDLLTSKTGGAYIPPAKWRMFQAKITDKSEAAFQRLTWKALKKSIRGCINKVNTSNIRIVVRELLRKNIVCKLI